MSLTNNTAQTVDYLEKSIRYLTSLRLKLGEPQVDLKSKVNSIKLLEVTVKKQLAKLYGLSSDRASLYTKNAFFGEIYSYLQNFERRIDVVMQLPRITPDAITSFDASLDELTQDIKVSLTVFKASSPIVNRENRIVLLRNFGFDASADDRNTKFLLLHWKEILSLKSSLGSDSYYFFREVLSVFAYTGLLDESVFLEFCSVVDKKLYFIKKSFSSFDVFRGAGILNVQNWQSIVSAVKTIEKQNPQKCYTISDIIFKKIADLSNSKLVDKSNFSFVLNELLFVLSKSKGAEEHVISNLPESVLKMFRNDGFTLVIRPIVESQTVASFLCFKQINSLVSNGAIANKDDAVFVVSIIKSNQRRASDILKNFLCAGVSIKVISTPISVEKECITLFLKESPVYLPELYSKFKFLLRTFGNSPDENKLYSGLFKDAKNLMRDIKTGSLALGNTYDSQLLIGALYSVFPPELSVDREMYENTFNSRNGRDSDIPSSISKYKKMNVHISRGSYVQTGEVDVSSWNIIVQAIEYVTKNNVSFSDEDYARFGLELLEGKIGEKLNRHIQLYCLFKKSGESLPSFSSERDTLMKYKEYVGDRLKNDVITHMLSISKDKKPAEFARLSSGGLNYKGLVKQISSIWNNNVTDRVGKIIKIVKFNGIPMSDEVLKGWPTPVADSQILLSIEGAMSGGIRKDIVTKIFGQISGEEYTGMQVQMKKFVFKSEGSSLFGDPFEFVLSKKKLHCVGMFSMGICVAPDDELWNSRDMWQMIIFDKDGYANGGCIYRTIVDGNKPYLVVSIQPSSGLVGSYSAEDIYSKIIQYSRILVKKLNYEGLLIPQSASIHSNRSSIQSCISSANYPVITTQSAHQFSYMSPYDYKYQSFYLV